MRTSGNFYVCLEMVVTNIWSTFWKSGREISSLEINMWNRKLDMGHLFLHVNHPVSLRPYFKILRQVDFKVIVVLNWNNGLFTLHLWTYFQKKNLEINIRETATIALHIEVLCFLGMRIIGLFFNTQRTVTPFQ